jgi:hypothetical protein
LIVVDGGADRVSGYVKSRAVGRGIVDRVVPVEQQEPGHTA